MTDIKYDKERDLIIIVPFSSSEIEVTPESFLDILDECLLLRIKRIKLLKITKMKELIKKAEKYENDIDKAETRFEVYKANSAAKVIDRIRYSVKLLEMEENQIKKQMLERQRGK